MKSRMVLTLLAVLVVAASAGAQTKQSGTVQCGKPDPVHSIEVGDKPNHTMGVSKSTCTWPKPIETAGLKAKDGYGVFADDTTAGKFTGHGVHISTMDNGDKFYVRYQGGGAMKDGVVQMDSGKWSYTGGTGKLKGIKGHGTYKGKGAPDGSVTYEIEGEYELGK
jgi:hypothetical protein